MKRNACGSVGAFRRRWGRLPLAAFANAFGASVGIFVLVSIVTAPGGAGMAYARSNFPDLFGDELGLDDDGGGGDGGGWARTRALVHDHGIAGAVLMSAMPVVLHPMALFAVAAGMPVVTLCMCVLAGRTVKYCMFGGLALAAPNLLARVLGRQTTSGGRSTADAVAETKKNT